MKRYLSPVREAHSPSRERSHPPPVAASSLKRNEGLSRLSIEMLFYYSEKLTEDMHSAVPVPFCLCLITPVTHLTCLGAMPAGNMESLKQACAGGDGAADLL